MTHPRTHAFRPLASTIALSAVLLSGLTAAPAMAQDDKAPPSDGAPAEVDPANDAEAQRMFNMGERFYAQGRYEAAAEAYLEAHRLSKRDALLFNIANTYERMNKLDEAISYFERYQPTAPEAEQRVIEQRLVALKKRQAAAAAPKPAPAPDPVNTAPVPPAPPAPLVPKTPPENGPSTMGPGIALLAVGGVGLIIGGVFGGLSLSKGSAKDQCTSGFCPDTAREDLDDQASFATVADVSFIIGGALAVTGIILVAIDGGTASDDTAPAATSAAITPLALPGGGGLQLIGTF